MFKFIIAFERRPGLTRQEAQDYLAEKHGPLVSSVPEFCRHCQGYVQNFAFDAGLPSEGFDVDGAAELWFDNVEIFIAAYAEPRYLELVRPDEPRFANPDRMVAAFTTETTLIEKSDHGAVKLFRFLAATPGISDADFTDRWQNEYGVTVTGNPRLQDNIAKYVQNWSTPPASNPFPLARPFVGVDQFWFADSDALQQFLSTECDILKKLGNGSTIDLANSVSFAATERRVLPA